MRQSTAFGEAGLSFVTIVSLSSFIFIEWRDILCLPHGRKLTILPVLLTVMHKDVPPSSSWCILFRVRSGETRHLCTQH